MKPPVLAVDLWHSNAHLIADVARLGYLRREYPTLDPTYGKGVFWRIWKPDVLVTHDIKLDGVDVRKLKDHHKKGEFPQVVFDPPYKLNGTPVLGEQDERYGTDQAYTSIDDDMQLMLQGFGQCAYVLSDGGTLLVKCQDQVVSGKVAWQTDWYTGWAHTWGLRKVDRFDMLGGGRPQPPGRRQVHARNRPSTLLIFRKEG
jgi:hypothetical protein